MRAFALGTITGIFITAGAILLATPAKADGYLDMDETIYVEAFAGAVCATLDDYPSLAGVMGIVQAIQEDGFTADNAVDIVNSSVANNCDEYWPLLQAVGRAARAANGSVA